jgi:hypothetical protein
MDKLKHLLNHLRQLPQRVLALLHKEQTVENNQAPILYTEEQLMARLKFFIGICLSLTLFGIVFVVLYSLIFVTQPLNAISPIDQKFFELIVPIATFLTGTLSGIMLAGGDKDAQKQALTAANAGWSRPPSPTPTAPSGGPSSGGFNSSPSGFTAPSAPSSGFGAPAGAFGSPVTAPAPGGFSASGFGSIPSAPTFGAPAVAMTASGKAIVPDMPQPEL